MPASDAFDAAIDEVARAMTDGAPDPAFSARVIARLESTPPRRSTPVWRVAFASAAAVAVALAVWQPWRGSMPRNEVTTAAHEPAPARPPAVENRDTGNAVDRRTTARVERGAVRTAASAGRLAPTDAPSRSISGATPAPIDVAPLTVEALPIAAVDAPASIQPDALEPVAPIAIAPLGKRR